MTKGSDGYARLVFDDGTVIEVTEAGLTDIAVPKNARSVQVWLKGADGGRASPQTGQSPPVQMKASGAGGYPGGSTTSFLPKK